MIKSQDLNKEIAQLELVAEKSNDEKQILKGVLKASCLLLKILRDMRTNQVLGLRGAKVELIKPSKPTEEPKK